MGAKATPSGAKCKCGYRFRVREHIIAERQNKMMTCRDCGRRYPPSKIAAPKSSGEWGQ